MKKYYIRIITCFLPLLLGFAPTTYAKSPFSQLVFFGDSLTDDGNLYSAMLHIMPKSPPYFNGRFSNGLLWSDHIANYYKVNTSNYAVGGETTIYHNTVNGYLPYTLTSSYDSYILHTSFEDRSKTLFIIWLGANDYLNGVKNIDKETTDVIYTLKYTIENLIYHGAKRFLVINLPDLSQIPFSENLPYKETLKNVTIAHNLKLQTAIETIQAGYKDVDIQSFNIYALLKDFRDHLDEINEKYHMNITDITHSCWNGGYTVRRTTLLENQLANSITNLPALSEANRVGASAAAGISPCANPDEFMFWDRVHPTTIAHKVIALNIIEYIDQHFKH